MDIGTAKPTRAEREKVIHHLIDILDPTQAYSAAQFCSETLSLIRSIRARGAQPLLVGGTMLYYKALTRGLNDLPSANAALRQALEAEAARLGWPALHARLAQLDPITAERLSSHDKQRIQRALEIWELTGKTMSSILRPGANPTPYRFIAMLHNGFIEEVEQLRARGDLHPGLPSIRCIGYRQIWSYLEGEIDHDTLQRTSIRATCELGKRQLTWLRQFKERHTIDCGEAQFIEHVITLAQQLLTQVESKNASMALVIKSAPSKAP
jgi:tRNA dimethylallyltransferase